NRDVQWIKKYKRIFFVTYYTGVLIKIDLLKLPCD
ncbi:MAG: hypothetical protein ACI93V_000893, partial [Alteromonadaceae bacterium]